MGKAIVIASGKGGTGKTMLAANLGTALALQGHKVALVDMDTGLRNLDLYVGLENNIVYDASDVLTGLCRIKQALIRVKPYENLFLMAASPQKPTGEVTPLHVKVLCDKLKASFDFVIVDAPAGIDDGLVVATGGCDMAIIVVTPDYASMRNSEMVESVITQQGIENKCYVVNRINLKLIREGKAPPFEELTKNIREKIIGIIQDDEEIQISVNKGEPIVARRDTYASRSFMAMARRVRRAAYNR